MLAAEYRIMREAEDTYWWYLALREHTIHQLVTTLGNSAHKKLKVLDAGCGTGGNLAQLHKNFPQWHLHGVDENPSALAATRHRQLAAELQAENINKLSYPDSTFDALLCIDVLYHQNIDAEKALSECYRVLRPGAPLFINTAAFPCLFGEHDYAIQTGRRFTKKNLLPLIKNTGFGIQKAYYWNIALFLPTLAHRIPSRFNSKKCNQPHKSDITTLPAPINNLLLAITRLDLRLARSIPYPLGTSLFVIAQKHSQPNPSHHASE